MARQQLKQDVQSLRDANSSSNSVVKNIEFDGDTSLSFDLVYGAKDKISITLILENYGKETITVMSPTLGMKDTNKRKLSDAIALIIQEHQPKLISFDQPKSALKDRKLLASSGGSSYSSDEEEEIEVDATTEVEFIPKEEADAILQKVLNEIEDLKSRGRRVGLVMKDNDFLIRLTLNTSFLNRWTASAWQIDPKLPIVVEIEFNWRYISAQDPPKVIGVFQTKEDLNCRKFVEISAFGVIPWFLQNRLNTCLRKNWVNKNKMDLSAYRVESEEDKLIKQITQLGFSRKQACTALFNSKNNLDRAIDLLMDQDLALAYELSEETKKYEFNTDIKVTHDENLFGGKNFLGNLCEYLEHKLLTCTRTCVICDSSMGFEGMKPTVCSKPLCTHSLEEYGLGVDIGGEIFHNGEVVDALITMTYAAAEASASRDCFNPFPSNVAVTVNNNTLSFLNKDQKNASSVLNVLNKIPPIGDLRKNREILKTVLDDINPLCFPLLRWIITSNRAHLVPLPQNQQIKQMTTNHQFVLCSANPEHERIFREKKAAAAKKYGGKGSFYAFHGSGLGNWHSIMRMGLKNYSNTKMMSAGAAYGPGIYMAKDATTSFGYMVVAKGWQNSSIGSNVACIALCEVVDIRKQTGTPVHDHGSIYVVEDESCVITRYLFVYPNGVQNYQSVDASTLKLPEDLYGN